MLDAYWQAIETELAELDRTRPTTADQVIATLNQHDPMRGEAVADAFFGGSGGDYSLAETLEPAGWDIRWIEAPYYWTARHGDSGEQLTYCEGDVYRGAHV